MRRDWLHSRPHRAGRAKLVDDGSIVLNPLRVALALVFVAGVAGNAQQPTFRTGVEVTTMDVTVVDDNGRPISDLKPSEFRVRIDGNDRRVTDAQWVSLKRPSGVPPSPPPPDGYSTNEDSTRGRLIVIAIDQPNIRADGAISLRSAVNGFIDRLEPSDRVAAVALGGGGSTSFTSDRAAVKRAIELMSGTMRLLTEMSDYEIGLGEAADIANGNTSILDRVFQRECVGRGIPPDQLPTCREQISTNSFVISTSVRSEAQQALLALRALLDSLKAVNAPKTVVIVSSGFVLGDEHSAIVEIGSMAAAAQTSLYVLRVDNQAMDASNSRRPATAVEDRQLRLDGVELLASVARGQVFDAIGTGLPAVERIERELSGYYLVGVESTPSDTDGKAHPISVQVSRRGTIVRARRELAHAAAAKTGSLSPLEEVAEALYSPLTTTGLPVRVATFSMRDPKDSRIQVVIHADVGMDYTSAKSAAIGYVVTDSKGSVVVNQTATGRLPPAVSGSPSPLVFSGSVSLEPGEYKLKFAVTEGDRVGSIEHPIHAGFIAAGSFSLSELMIGGPLDARQLLAPTVGYEVRFGNVQGYIEAYGAAADRLLMRYEIARGIDAPALFSAVVPGRSGGDDRTVFSYAMPVRELTPGEYYLRATLSSPGPPGTSVIKKVARAFRVAPTPATSASGSSTTTTGAPLAVAPRAVSLSVRDELFARGFRPEDVSRGDATARFRETVAPGARSAFDEGVASLAARDTAKAEQAFRSVLDAALAGTDNTAALAYLGATYAAAGRDPEAISIWQIALIEGSEFPQLYEWLADAFMRLRNVSEARAILEEANRKWPAETRFEKPLAIVLAKLGMVRDAVAMLERFLTQRQDDTDALYLGVEWMYQVLTAGAVVNSREQDLKMAQTWADAYTLAGGPQVDVVKRWMLALETSRTPAPAAR